tara:strand:- start:842 stop:2008 length:1167 start_codon:yes stop_codon:yes gene_type:complete
MARDPLGDAVRAQRAARIARQQGDPVRNPQLQQPGSIDPGMLNEPFFQIHITHIPTGQKVKFDGWVTEFSDSYTQRWNETQVYGRMDPLSTYQGTTRQISLGFDIVSDSLASAEDNMKNIARFLKFQYPVYQSTGLQHSNVLKGAPLMAFKWTNLISSPNNVDNKLIGYINGGINYAPDMNEGGFLLDQIIEHAPNPADTKRAIRNYIPKQVSLNFTFTVLHTHLPGWSNPTLQSLTDQFSDELKEALGDEGLSNVQKATYIFGGDFTNNDRFPNIYTDAPVSEDVAQARATAAERAAETAEGLQQADDLFNSETAQDGEVTFGSTEGAARRDAIEGQIRERQQAIDERQAALSTRVTDRLRQRSVAGSHRRRDYGAGADALRELFGE